MQKQFSLSAAKMIQQDQAEELKQVAEELPPIQSQSKSVPAEPKQRPPSINVSPGLPKNFQSNNQVATQVEELTKAVQEILQEQRRAAERVDQILESQNT